MNYRHAFHAGNFADVFKHLILTRVLLYLTRKETPLRFIDTHAGHGSYDLSGEAAERTSEWRSGIGRLLEAATPGDLDDLIAPYRDLVEPLFRAQPPLYPGSPLLAARLLRSQDKMIFCDASTAAVTDLAAHFVRDRRAKVIDIDGYVGLNAFVPPVERRGLVLIDPPFEIADEFARLAQALAQAWRKWTSGIYMVWFPIKQRSSVETFLRALEQAGLRRMLRIELRVDAPQAQGALAANGLLIVNPPYVLEEEARRLLPFLAERLGTSPQSGFEVAWIAGE